MGLDGDREGRWGWRLGVGYISSQRNKYYTLVCVAFDTKSLSDHDHLIP